MAEGDDARDDHEDEIDDARQPLDDERRIGRLHGQRRESLGERGEAGRIGPDARSLDQGPGARCVDLHHVVDAETAHVPAAPDLKARWGEISQA
jgi:hypothetical protein